eukprot:CAMPEP_0181295320 /NCGR_PEP_ID=MMETSP1101-20121128/4084_1 /TAXON_ID=46948 /ORGANISM="Rhodomonas abbreviata, Strain Caron Lab Isolate" /LENGTH=226 /DNA_ID=CAMNT_0023400063 /DNA_START=668 /DNA_END=1348 /DNA_ORIENTATION=+
MIDYGVALCLVVGMCLFAGADLHGSSMSSVSAADWRTLTGIFILCGSLCCDSLLGNLQEKVQKSKACSETELMFIQSAFGSVALLLLTAATGELFVAVKLSNKAVWIGLIGWALSNMAGVVCLLKIVGEFSAVTAVLTSFVRKLSSITISYIVFPKPISLNHFLGLLLVFGAIGIHSWHKQVSKAERKPEPHHLPVLLKVVVEGTEDADASGIPRNAMQGCEQLGA